MKKGLIFIIIVAAIYWGYYFIYRKPARPIATSQEIIHKSNLNILETSIEIFRQKEGRYPDGLNELVEQDYLKKLPDTGGRDWEYNPGDGLVN